MNPGFKVHIVRVWSELVAEVAQKWLYLLRALWLPALLMAMCEWIANHVGGVGAFIFGILYWFFGAMFAVSIHRIVLLSPSSLSNPWGVYLDRYVFRYIGFLLLIGFVAIFLGIGLGIVIMPLGTAMPGLAPLIMLAALWLLLLYVMARVNLVLPAQAVGDRLDIVEVFRMTQGNGWRLVIATFLPILLIGVLLAPLTWWARGLPAEVAAFPMVLNILLSGMIGIAVLSCAYRQFRGRTKLET